MEKGIVSEPIFSPTLLHRTKQRDLSELQENLVKHTTEKK